MTTADIRKAVGATIARDVASRLVAKKVLERVAQGKYLIRPLRTQSRPTTVSAAVQTAILLQGEVQAAVALFTGDDMANLRPDLLKEGEKPEELTPQPRPNVLLEAGIASWDSLLC